MIDVIINKQSLRDILSGPPVIKDSISSVCRTLDLTVQNSKGLENYMGQLVELWYGGKRWFMGFLMRRSKSSDGSFTYTAYDPLYYLKRYPDDWYLKNMTATQGFTELARRAGVRVLKLASTGAVFPALYYQNAPADKVAVDLLARTYAANGKRFWFRYQPDKDADGILLFEKVVPEKIWAFQVGVNLESASTEESLEEAATVVKLINRETGKVVTRADADTIKRFGQMVHFEEVSKEEAKTMEKKAQDLLKSMAKVKTTMNAAGVNPNMTIPQLWSGDAVYVEEANTGLLGGYYITNISQSFDSDSLISIAFDIQVAPDIPVVQYEDATKDPNAEKAKKKKKKEDEKKSGVQQEYSKEVTDLMNKYGV